MSLSFPLTDGNYWVKVTHVAWLRPHMEYQLAMFTSRLGKHGRFYIQIGDTTGRSVGFQKVIVFSKQKFYPFT